MATPFSPGSTSVLRNREGVRRGASGWLADGDHWIVIALCLALLAVGQLVLTNEGDLGGRGLITILMVAPLAFVHRRPGSAAALAVVATCVAIWSLHTGEGSIVAIGRGQPVALTESGDEFALPLAAVAALLMVLAIAASRMASAWAFAFGTPFCSTRSCLSMASLRGPRTFSFFLQSSPRWHLGSAGGPATR